MHFVMQVMQDLGMHFAMPFANTICTACWNALCNAICNGKLCNILECTLPCGFNICCNVVCTAFWNALHNAFTLPPLLLSELGSSGPRTTQTCLPQSTFSKWAHSLGMSISRSKRAPILKMLIAPLLCHHFYYQNWNVFTAINIFKMGTFPGYVHFSPQTGAHFENVDCPFALPPLLLSELGIFRNQGGVWTQYVCMYTYIYIYIYITIYTYIYTPLSLIIQKIYIYINMCVYLSLSLSLSLFIYNDL